MSLNIRLTYVSLGAILKSHIVAEMQVTEGASQAARVSNGSLPRGRRRRIIQMLFAGATSTEASDAHDSMIPTSPVAINQDARTEEEQQLGVSTTRLNALKRKLFPSEKRRHPARIPPLVVSPITMSPSNNQPDHEAQDEPQSSTNLIWGVKDEEPAEQVDGNDEESDGDIDDDLVDAIEEADRLRSTTSEETITQMSQTIESLQQWKANHQLETQNALREMEERAERDFAVVEQAGTDEAADTALMDTAQRYQHAAQVAREKLLMALHDSEHIVNAKQLEDERIAYVLLDAERQAANDAANGATANSRVMQKLREEVFELGVKELSSNIHTSWMQELEGAENELEMKLLDVEAFTSELDMVLAQFDSALTVTTQPSTQNPSGQEAHEH